MPALASHAMLILHPHAVQFGSSRFESVSVIAVERSASRLVVDRGDAGSQAIFADVPEELVTLRIVQHLTEQDLDPPRCGDLASISWFTSASASEGQRTRFSAQAVVRSIRYDIPGARAARASPALTSVSRTITLVALSPDGHSDPIATTPADASL